MEQQRDVSLIWNPLQSIKILIEVVIECVKCISWWCLLVLLCVSMLAGFRMTLSSVPLFLSQTEEIGLWAFYWIGLGVASSIGLGTGLHTFVLYLGPHIAKVALMSYSCGQVAIPVPSKFNPQSFSCPLSDPSSPPSPLSILHIIQAVQLESILWGVGTALGELPPYFVAKAAALAKQATLADELQDIHQIQKNKSPSLVDRIKLNIYHYLQKNAFLTVLLCASIPNPLFDLAGITCGHFLIPFTTFFTATCLGKAFIKTHIQIFSVVFVFSKDQINQVLTTTEYYLPFLKGTLSAMFEKQKQNLIKPKVEDGSKPLVAQAWDIFITAMILYFLCSILDSIVNSRYQQQTKKDKKIKPQ